jgi:8-oxo-dGTP diphosphatase
VQQVTAALFERQGRVLLARRKPGRHMGSLWEFPGGKVDSGETAEACLARELAEELGVSVRVGEFLGSTRFRVEDSDFELLLFRVEHLSGEFQLREHEEIRWVAPAELEAYELVESDRELARVCLRSS